VDHFGNTHWLKKVTVSYGGVSMPSGTKSLIVLPDSSPGNMYWYLGHAPFGKRVMHAKGSLVVTNTFGRDILVVGIKMKNPKALGSAQVKKVDDDSYSYGEYPIPANKTTKVQFEIIIDPAFREEGEAFTADLAVMDQFGNENIINAVEFRYPGPPKT
jgi:hypothetical protein